MLLQAFSFIFMLRHMLRRRLLGSSGFHLRPAAVQSLRIQHANCFYCILNQIWRRTRRTLGKHRKYGINLFISHAFLL